LASIAIVPVPPDAVNDSGASVAETLHFKAEGVLSVEFDDVHAPVSVTATSAAKPRRPLVVTSRHRRPARALTRGRRVTFLLDTRSLSKRQCGFPPFSRPPAPALANKPPVVLM
jgi:hypothetical protein